jgi:hypothetical protein
MEEVKTHNCSWEEVTLTSDVSLEAVVVDEAFLKRGCISWATPRVVRVGGMIEVEQSRSKAELPSLWIRKGIERRYKVLRGRKCARRRKKREPRIKTRQALIYATWASAWV